MLYIHTYIYVPTYVMIHTYIYVYIFILGLLIDTKGFVKPFLVETLKVVIALCLCLYLL